MNIIIYTVEYTVFLHNNTMFAVNGFFQTNLDGHERGWGYPIRIGYLKGSGPIFRARIEDVPGGTAGMK